VHLGTGTVDSADNVGHTGLVGTEGGEVGSGGGIIVTGERTDATSVVLGTLLGEESQVTATGGFELRWDIVIKLFYVFRIAGGG